MKNLRPTDTVRLGPEQQAWLDDGPIQPVLRPSGALLSVPADAQSPLRAYAGRTWRAMRAPVDEVMRDQAELDKADRAILTLRRQLHAAQQEVQAQRARAEAAEKLRRPVLIGAGVAVGLFGVAWLVQRRQLVALRELALQQTDGPLSSSLLSAPTSVGPEGR